MRLWEGESECEVVRERECGRESVWEKGRVCGRERVWSV